MGVKTRQIAADSPKVEVGEIDTRAPFESVKAAVSLFGEGAFSTERSSTRKPKPQSSEQRSLAKETQLHLAQKEFNKLKEQLSNAETTRIQALSELETAKKTVEDLTRELASINKSKELALKSTEDARDQTKHLAEAISSDGSGNDGAWKQELDSTREQYAVAITELDAAKQELRRIRNDLSASVDAKISAFQRESEAKQASDANREKTTHLSNEIVAARESLIHVKLATEQARREESKIRSEKDLNRHSYKLGLEENEKKKSSLTREFEQERSKNLESKLAETTAEIGAIQKEMDDAKASEMESVKTVTTELGGARSVLERVLEEEVSLKREMEALKQELEGVKKEHSELRERDAEAETLVGNLHVELRRCRAELESAAVAESTARLVADDLTSALQLVSMESEAAERESEGTKGKAEEMRREAEAAKLALSEAEEKLRDALADAEEAKGAEASAVNRIKELSEKAMATRSSTSEHGANIRISPEEFDSLSRKAEESEKLAEMKVGAAAAQVEAVRASEDEAIKRLAAARKEMEDVALATEAAVKRAEMADAAKKAVEGELRRWREREQKKAAEAATRILAESSKEPMVTAEASEAHRKVYRPSPSKKKLMPSISAIFSKKKSQGSPSYLPGEKPV